MRPKNNNYFGNALNGVSEINYQEFCVMFAHSVVLSLS